MAQPAEMTKTTKAEKRAFLQDRGWTRISDRGAETWTHPDYPGGFFSLAIAYAVAKGQASLAL